MNVITDRALHIGGAIILSCLCPITHGTAKAELNLENTELPAGRGRVPSVPTSENSRVFSLESLRDDIARADMEKADLENADIENADLEIIDPVSNESLPVEAETAIPSQGLERTLVEGIRVVYRRADGTTDSAGVFPESEFDRIFREYTAENGNYLTVEQVREIADQITSLYAANNYITSKAIRIRETAENSIVTIVVVEGELTRINIDQGETDWIDPAYIRNRLALGISVPLNTIDLGRQLRLLRLDPIFGSVEATLESAYERNEEGIAEAEKIGQNVLEVRVRPANPVSSALTLDNYSPPVVGAERFGAGIRRRNATGRGDELSAAYTITETGGAETFDVSYALPINPYNGRLVIRSSWDWTRIPAAEGSSRSDIEGSSERYEVALVQPVFRSPEEEFSLSLGLSFVEKETVLDLSSNSFIVGVEESLSRSASNSFTARGVSRTSVIRFGQDYVKRDDSGSWTLGSQFHLGVDLLGATLNESPIPDGRFFSWSGKVQRVQEVGNNHLIIAQGLVQLASDSLFPEHQLVLGGARSVRGVRQNVRLGDNGFSFTLEDRITLRRNESGASVLELIPFIDAGLIWNTQGNPNELPEQRFLAGTGAGLIWGEAFGVDNLSLRFDAALPLVNLADRGNNFQDVAVYFGVTYEP